MKRYQRKAMSYVLVLGTAMVITVIGLSALSTMRLRWRSTKNSTDFLQTRLYAQSAIDIGLFYIENTPDWRNVRPSGLWVDRAPFGNGFYSITGIDPIDNDLSDSAVDPVILTGIGFQGDARFKLQVTLQPELIPISSLEVALHADVSLKFNGCILQCNQIISSNGTVNSATSTIDSDVEAVGSITGATYHGNLTSPIPPRLLPGSTVFDYYLANGTMIPLNLIGKKGGVYTIENVVISPNSNPYDNLSTNPKGIYIIECAGQNVVVQNSRIVGTLVLLGPGPNSQITKSVNWEPAVENYPVLLVHGNLSINLDPTGADLLEGDKTGNFNPPGTPYDGVEDSDTTDSYPSLITGLIYVSGDISTEARVAVEGVVVIGNSLIVTTGATVDLKYESIYYDSPPPGFYDIPNMIIADRSWKQVVD